MAPLQQLPWLVVKVFYISFLFRTRKVKRSALSSELLLVLTLWKSKTEPPPCALDLWISYLNPPSFPLRMPNAVCGRVWIFFAITHFFFIDNARHCSQENNIKLQNSTTRTTFNALFQYCLEAQCVVPWPIRYEIWWVFLTSLKTSRKNYLWLDLSVFLLVLL